MIADEKAFFLFCFLFLAGGGLLAIGMYHLAWMIDMDE